MIVYIVTDTAKRYRANLEWIRHQQTLERLSGDVCLTVHYKKVNARLLADLRPWALCHSGAGTPYDEYDVLDCQPFRQAVLDYPGAQIGLCGGCQILAVYFGSRVAPMRPLGADEPDLSSYTPGAFKEWGFYPVRILRQDPLFDGFGRVVRVQEFHAWEIKRLGSDLDLLASTPACRVQTFRHRERPIYGTQFHPERANKLYPDGFQILKNFFRIARRAARRASCKTPPKARLRRSSGGVLLVEALAGPPFGTRLGSSHSRGSPGVSPSR